MDLYARVNTESIVPERPDMFYARFRRPPYPIPRTLVETLSWRRSQGHFEEGVFNKVPDEKVMSVRNEQIVEPNSDIDSYLYNLNHMREFIMYSLSCWIAIHVKKTKQEYCLLSSYS